MEDGAVESACDDGIARKLSDTRELGKLGVPGEEFPEPISLPGGFGLIIPLRRAA
ncbi:hypothetical protein [Enorma sp.]|uniref:hypothetical protein n=1 Tax=Enorma sp. TaxID=1920692 RepID=UPI0025BBBF75|nr:hypothetical protein [Enorma sp.]